MPLETDEGMNTVLLSQRSGRHWNWCNSQTPIIWSMLVPGRAQPSLGAARDTIPGAVGELGMCSGLTSGRDLSLLYCNHPSSVAQPRGTAGATPSPECGAAGDPGSCRSIGNTGSREAPALLGSTHSLGADKPPTQTGSELRARPGEFIYKVPLVLGTKSNVQDILQQTARAGPSLHYLQKDSSVQTLYNRLLPFSYEGK